MIAAFVGLAVLFVAPIPFIKNRRHRFSLGIMALLVLGVGGLVVAMGMKRSENQSAALFFALIALFWLAGRFDARGPDSDQGK